MSIFKQIRSLPVYGMLSHGIRQAGLRLADTPSLVELNALRLTGRLFLLVTILQLVMILLNMWIGKNASDAYSEATLLTWVSGLQLMAAGFFAQQLWTSIQPDRVFSWANPRAIWRILAIGFWFLALDDLFQIHENLDLAFHAIVGWDPNGPTDCLDDLIVVCYGIFGVAMLLRYRKELLRYIPAWPYLAGAAICTLGTAAFDLVGGGGAVTGWFFSHGGNMGWLMINPEALEESLKTYSGVFFVGMLARCYTIALSRNKETGSSS